MSRREETMRQREKKTSDDLTKLKLEQERMVKLREEQNAREQDVRRLEIEGKKHREESEKRITRAIEVERETKARIRSESLKLELLRKNIERINALATVPTFDSVNLRDGERTVLSHRGEKTLWSFTAVCSCHIFWDAERSWERRSFPSGVSRATM